MRLLLDANLSPKSVGDALSARGHDVRAVAAEPDLDAAADEDLLMLAAADDRILVTRNSRDFAPISRAWAEAGREHAGLILVWTLSTRQHGELIRGIESWLERQPAQEDWRGLVVAI